MSDRNDSGGWWLSGVLAALSVILAALAVVADAAGWRFPWNPPR